MFIARMKNVFSSSSHMGVSSFTAIKINIFAAAFISFRSAQSSIPLRTPHPQVSSVLCWRNSSREFGIPTVWPIFSTLLPILVVFCAYPSYFARPTSRQRRICHPSAVPYTFIRERGHSTEQLCNDKLPTNDIRFQ